MTVLLMTIRPPVECRLFVVVVRWSVVTCRRAARKDMLHGDMDSHWKETCLCKTLWTHAGTSLTLLLFSPLPYSILQTSIKDSPAGAVVLIEIMHCLAVLDQLSVRDGAVVENQ